MATDNAPGWCVNGSGEGDATEVVSMEETRVEPVKDFPRKRVRSSGSNYTDESGHSGEASPKKSKVDSSFELSERVATLTHTEPQYEDQNNDEDKVGNNLCKVADTGGGGKVNNDVGGQEGARKTIIKQVEELARKRDLVTDFVFIKPPDFKYKIGHRSDPADYLTNLVLKKPLEDGEDVSTPVHTFVGEARMPYEAMRAAALKALAFLSSDGSPSRGPRVEDENSEEEAGDSKQDTENTVNNDEQENTVTCDSSPKKNYSDELVINDKDGVNEQEVNGVEEDSDLQSVQSDIDSDCQVEELNPDKNDSGGYIESLKNFWDKALKHKYPAVEVLYQVIRGSEDENEETDEDKWIVECAIGKLVVDGNGKDEMAAQEMAAQSMFSLIENILNNEGTESLRQSIHEGEGEEEGGENYGDDKMNGSSPKKSRVKQDVETVDDDDQDQEEVDVIVNDVEEDDPEVYDEDADYVDDEDDEVYPEQASMLPPHLAAAGYQAMGRMGHQYQQHHQQQQLHHQQVEISASPAKSDRGSSSFGSSCQTLPGHEYALSLTSLSSRENQVLDLPNLPRRLKFPMMSLMAASEVDAEMSDDEEAEGGRILAVFQQMLGMASVRRLNSRHKQQLTEMITRAGLAASLPSPYQQPSHPLGSMYHSQAQMFGNSSAAFQQPQILPRVQQPPPKPVAPPKPPPLNTLCKFPDPPIEGVGAVTVSRDDYKTLQIGTFLNDVIIDYYLKWLQFTQFKEADKNRVHIFTTFWFSKLTQKPSPIEARKDPVQRRYDRVKRWTRKVNIFEKDFVVVPINENYHWYLCIICYPGMVGCQSVEDGNTVPQPRSQRVRRKKKDAIKGIKRSMNAVPRKNDDDERDEPLASEDEIEHENDSLDVDLWQEKKKAWDVAMEKRRVMEEQQRIEMERQRAEWEERRRQWEEQQRKLMEEQARKLEEEQERMEEEKLKRQLEAEENGDDDELGEEEENWDNYDDEEEKCDEYGNPVVNSRPVSDIDEEVGDDESVVRDIHQVGGFADAAKYQINSLPADTENKEESLKSKQMAADWDDWGSEEDMEEDMLMDDRFITSLQTHRAEDHLTKVATSGANRLTRNVNTDFVSMVAHQVVKDLTHTRESVIIPQIDGMVDEDEEMTKDEESTGPGDDDTEEEGNGTSNGTTNESVDEIVFKSQTGALGNLVGYADTSDTEVDSDNSIMIAGKSENMGESKVAIQNTDEENINENKIVDDGAVSNDQDSSATSPSRNEEGNDSNSDAAKPEDLAAGPTSEKVDNDQDTGTEAENAHGMPLGKELKPDTHAEVMDVSEDEQISNEQQAQSVVKDEEPSNELPSSPVVVPKSPDVGNQSPEIDQPSPDAPNQAVTADHQADESVGENDMDYHQSRDYNEPCEIGNQSPTGSDTEPYSSGSEEDYSKFRVEEKGESDSDIEEMEVMEDEPRKSNYEKNDDEDFDASHSEDEVEDEGVEDEEEEDFDDDDTIPHVPVRQPCILVFDSLGGKKDRQARLCQTLRDFLSKEFEEKFPGQTREFSTRTMPGSAPKVQQQPNLTDCGLYLCQNTEAFFKYPISDFTLPITSLHNWFPEAEVRYKRRDVAALIRKMSTQQNPDKLDQLQFPDLVFVEPEREVRRQEEHPKESRREEESAGSDGEGGEEYRSDDDQGSYQSSPLDVEDGDRRKDFTSSEDDDDPKREDDRRNENDRRNTKRYRSDDSLTDSPSRSSHRQRSQKRRKDRRDSSSDSSDRSEDDFDSSAVYGGARGSRDREANRDKVRRNSSGSSNDITECPPESGIRQLPSGISVSRAVERGVENDNATMDDHDDMEHDGEYYGEDLDSSAQDCSTLDRTESLDRANEMKSMLASRLPPGISFSSSKADEEIQVSSEDESMDELDSEHNQDANDITDEKMSSRFPSMVAHRVEKVMSSPITMVAHQIVGVYPYQGMTMHCHREILAKKEDVNEDVLPQVDGAADVDSDEEGKEEENIDEPVPSAEESLNDHMVQSVSEEVETGAEEVNEDFLQEPLEGMSRDVEETNMENPGLENEVDPDLEDEGLAADTFMENQGTEDVDMGPEEELHNNEEFVDFVQDGELSHTEEPINQHVIPGAEFSSEVFDEESDPHNEPEEVVDPESNDLQTAEELEEVGEKSYVNSGRPLMQAPWSSEVVEDEEYEDHSDYEEGEDEEMYEDENYSYGAYQEDEGVSPPKKAREQVNEVEEEVILDSDDEDDNVESNEPSEQVGEAARWQHHMRGQQDNSSYLRQQTAMRGPQYQVDSQLMAHQLLLQQQQAARAGGYPGLARGTQVYTQEVPGQKRKHRPSMAMCIKDGKVYMKPFTELPISLTTSQNSKSSQQQQVLATKPVLPSHLYQTNQYKPQEKQTPMFGNQLTVQQMSLAHQQGETMRQQVREKQEIQLGTTLQNTLQDRLRNLPAGLQVQQSGGTKQPVYEEVVDDEDSLDNDEDKSDLYNSDDPEEEIINDVDTSVEQVDSSSVVEDMRVNEVEEYNEVIEDDSLEEGQEEVSGTDETLNDIDHSEPVELRDTQEALSGDLLAFEQTSKDVQEACEENDAGVEEETRGSEVEETENNPVSPKDNGLEEETRGTDVNETEYDPVLSAKDKEESQEDSPVKNDSTSEETM